MTGQLADMIHEILETSKAERSVEDETPAEVDLSKMLSSLCGPYRLTARAKGIIFWTKLPDSFETVLPPRMFGKAISNILANAVAYTEPGGRISVFLDGREIRIENECRPISREAMRHIFEPFYRPDSARDRNKGGNGLGLYIVDSLLKAMNIPYSFCPMEEPQGMRFIIYM